MNLSKTCFTVLLLIFIISTFLSGCVQKSTLPAGDIDNGGLFLPVGFEAVVVADSIGHARHLAVNKNGDIYVKLTYAKQDSGNVAIRDSNNDGKADNIAYFGDYKAESGYGPTGMRIYNGYIYFSTKGAVYRQKLTPGKLIPESKIELVLTDNYITEHIGKSLAFDDDGHMYVNFGSISNNCQIDNRTPESPGQYPCAELAEHAGIWRFDANKLDQTQKDGVRYATGLRDGIAMDWNQATNTLFAVEHGRDGLHQTWPSLYSEWESALLPSEEFFEVKEGMNGGWPYYYYDQLQQKKVVAPEYHGVDLKEVDKPANPLIGFPGHWAPNDLFFYTGNQFPDHYKNGAFIAFHGSSNRAPYQQSGFFVCFVPFKNGVPSGSWEVFADGFAEQETIVSSSDAAHRPMGIAMGADGSLYISDIVTGKIWRIMYKGNKENFGTDQLAKMEGRKMLKHLKTPDKVKDNLVKGMADEGQKIYTAYCISCHQKNGKGDGNRYPPLEESDWVTGDKNRLITVVLEGLKGPITVNGKLFNGEMPKHDFLSDAEVSKVTSYIRLNFKNNAGVIHEKEVANVRNKLKSKQ
ncbi:glucose/arabinose dehydrogenase [Larkinella arboricola]|uniref:Glucose/arabinose dehydrogenase n=1 Tax=Larkinella arboricola TaxID=643671 RepID=A0A327WL86_LARAB|nr:c-type cytochrome [Larkinella arboricola]RAJ91011.1 glucose/arabinose dehydrogenase [Larkinella arboricola]